MPDIVFPRAPLTLLRDAPLKAYRLHLFLLLTRWQTICADLGLNLFFPLFRQFYNCRGVIDLIRLRSHQRVLSVVLVYIEANGLLVLPRVDSS